MSPRAGGKAAAVRAAVRGEADVNGPAAADGTHELCLYVTGSTTPGQRALANLRAILESVLAERYTLDVVDVLEAPERAKAEKILATATLVLVRRRPAPVRRLIGDFSDRKKVLQGLDITLPPALPG